MGGRDNGSVAAMCLWTVAAMNGAPGACSHVVFHLSA